MPMVPGYKEHQMPSPMLDKPPSPENILMAAATMDMLGRLREPGVTNVQMQDSEGNVLGDKRSRHSRETAEQHQQRLEPFRQELPGLIKEHEKQMGTTQDKMTPGQLQQFQNSKGFKSLLKKIPSPPDMSRM